MKLKNNTYIHYKIKNQYQFNLNTVDKDNIISKIKNKEKN